MSGWMTRASKWVSLGLILFSARLPAGEGPAGVMVIVADGRRFTGVRAWWANLYNESHLYFALLTVLLVPAAGALLGMAADRLMSHLGIDLKSRSLRES